jgi:DNA repair protein SbcD/Mre11
MKILHTSDWHLGRSLYGQKRYEEFSAFLDWLAQTIEEEKVDALLVAGDVFDTTTPGNRAQELYYRFLCRVAASCCRHVVVIAGNHDSPSFLNAPKELLRVLNVYVVGSMTDDPADEVIVLQNNPQISQMNADDVEAIICAVPYLRDKDIRTVEAGETIDDKNRKLVGGLKMHYEAVVAVAETKRNNLQKSAQSADKYIPIIAMGHLFTAGGKTVSGDGVRELYVGSLAHVGKEAFPSSIDYLALGHLHVPQAVGSAEHIRYSGSPIPMGYGESTQEKKVVIVEFNGTTPDIQELPVPCFQELVRIVGSLDDIHAKIDELKTRESTAWLEIEYTGSDIVGNLREMIYEALAGSTMEIQRIHNQSVMDRVINAINEDETLDDLKPEEVFVRYLDTHDVPDEEREKLTVSYNEIITALMEEDKNAE